VGRGDLEIKVKEIKGRCSVYKEGDSFLILDGYKLKTDNPICMHALSSIMPYYVALSVGISPRILGLGDEEQGYVQCLDPCEYTGGGTVIFEIRKED